MLGVICRCGLVGAGVVAGTGSVAAGVVLGLVTSDLSKTFQASSAIGNGSTASRVSVVLSLFAGIWGGCFVVILYICYSKQTTALKGPKESNSRSKGGAMKHALNILKRSEGGNYSTSILSKRSGSADTVHGYPDNSQCSDLETGEVSKLKESNARHQEATHKQESRDNGQERRMKSYNVVHRHIPAAISISNSNHMYRFAVDGSLPFKCIEELQSALQQYRTFLLLYPDSNQDGAALLKKFDDAWCLDSASGEFRSVTSFSVHDVATEELQRVSAEAEDFLMCWNSRFGGVTAKVEPSPECEARSESNVENAKPSSPPLLSPPQLEEKSFDNFSISSKEYSLSLSSNGSVSLEGSFDYTLKHREMQSNVVTEEIGNVNGNNHDTRSTMQVDARYEVHLYGAGNHEDLEVLSPESFSFSEDACERGRRFRMSDLFSSASSSTFYSSTSRYESECDSSDMESQVL
eukprot:gene28618-34548_t